MMCQFHPILKEIESQFEVLANNKSSDKFEIIKKFNLPKNREFDRFYGNIGWGEISDFYKFNFGNRGTEEVQEALCRSRIFDYKHVIVEVGYTGPIVRVETKLFISYWEEFLFASCEGFPLISDDGKLICEFLDTHKIIYSNFLVK